MSEQTPLLLTPVRISLAGSEFAEILTWQFADAYVRRLLETDIPNRINFGHGKIWGYSDPVGRLVAFGTLDVCEDYASETGGRPHPYIPLLARNKSIKGIGPCGPAILAHLVDEAAVLACTPDFCCDRLFLDVYVSNTGAIQLYTERGFQVVTTEPIPDPQENGTPYIVMARRVSVGTGTPTE